ncbi:uncharacterized protein G2W53_044986 [Senna tora]|uniref:Uncharacterized protein n=1 Tax=Senna tora TaxID=362788 RepID=A0A834VWV4_9FABA|nr:uncharacterized protein G2W53_044986 [Senna tora]
MGLNNNFSVPRISRNTKRFSSNYKRKPSKRRNTNPEIARPMVEREQRSKTIMLHIVIATHRRPQRHLPSSSTLLPATVVAL